MKADVIALIPAYNEALHIAPVAAGAREFVPVLVVDDGSVDDTAICAQEAGATVLRQWPNQGKGAALRAGMRWALDRNCQAVLTLDADGQHDPADIPAFLRLWNDGGADLIIGARDFRQIPLTRRVANTLGRWSFSWAMGQPIHDNQSGFRLLTRRMMETALELTSTGFEFEVEMIVQCVRQGYPLAWVPIRTIYAGERSHIRPLTHIVRFLRLVRRTRQMMAGVPKQVE